MLAFKSYGSSSAGNCHIISDGKTSIMLDAGLPLKKIRQLGVKVSGLAGCLISHSHQDHCKGAPALASAACDVYMFKETREALNLSGHRYHDITSLEQFRVGSFTVTPFGLVHDVPNAGFLLQSGHESAVYITDTAYCEHTFKGGLTLIAIECNYSANALRESVKNGAVSPDQKKRILGSHFGLDNVLGFLSANDLSKLKEIHLLHLSDRNSDEAEIKREVQKVTGVPVTVAAA